MLKVSFCPYNGANWYERVEATILNDCVSIDALMDFFHSQYPHMCGPIHVEKDGAQMGKEGEDWIYLRPQSAC